jgi:NADH-quinone oxidoreductase subunit C
MDRLSEYFNGQKGYSFDEVKGHQWDLSPDSYMAIMAEIKDHPACLFEQCIDLTVVDMLTYGQTEWESTHSTSQGFSRATLAKNFEKAQDPNRFVLVVHLLSVTHNHRLRVKCVIPKKLIMPSLVFLWPSVLWYEREAYDLFGIVFKDHPDLRRLLTDYGFVGHPFRKDFPTSGYVQMHYSHEEQACVYEPVTIEERVLVPKVIRPTTEGCA